MKFNYLLYTVLLLSFVFVSCTKETEGLSEPTAQIQFERIGNGVELINQGQEYTDAGAVAYYLVPKVGVEDEFDTINVEATVVTSLDSSLPGAYSIGYKATNNDGIEFYSGSSVNRKVVVISETDEISGEYKVLLCQRDGVDLTADVGTVLLYELYSTDEMVVYDYSDWIGGWYDQAYGYGAAYAFGGRLGITNDNKIIHLSSSNPWGIPGGIDDPSTTSFDPATKTIDYVYNWTAGYNFTIKIQKL